VTNDSRSTLPTVAQAYRAAGLCVLPAIRVEKRPSIGKWKTFQTRLPTQTELSAWFARDPDAICLICGQVSDNLEIIDFDAGGELFPAWADRIPHALRDRLAIETTQSGGRHVVYRCETQICGNMKLAQRKDDDAVITLIETRGEGGLFLCAPTAGYEVVQGDMCRLPVLTEAERDMLLQAAWTLNEYVPPIVDFPGIDRVPDSVSTPSVDRPGDDYNRRGDVPDVLRQHGWTHVRGGENEYWRRPGKTLGWSATLKDRVFYVFSANASPFEPQQAYSPFSVYALLEHGGDYEQAARSLRQFGYGGDSAIQISSDVDLSGIVGRIEQPLPMTSGLPDPGPLPEELLRVPGFISEVMDHCLETAPYPNRTMAFCGALALQSFLAGRKVRDPGDNRTNLYLLGLAHSSAGKDWPRKLNIRILHEIGLTDCVGERFASGEGIQDSLFVNPCTLFQTDEIDGMLQSINNARDARHENIMSTLLTLYSSANSVYPMRRKAGKELPGVIDQPCLTIFGTAIPNHYYEALSERMLTNGFFARMLILECGSRGKGQEPSIQDLPASILETAKWWADFHPGMGNLESWHPVPAIVKQTDEAKRILVRAREEAEAEYAKAEQESDAVGTTVWGRVSEHVRKLALLYAVSENHTSPKISKTAVEWAVRFVMHQTRRMLFMAQSHVADSPFQAECLKLMQKLRDAPGNTLSHSVLLKRMKVDARAFQDIIATLDQRGDVAITIKSTGGRPSRFYRLLEGKSDKAGKKEVSQ